MKLNHPRIMGGRKMTPTTTPKSTIKILLVEDQGMLRDIYCGMLHDRGYDCRTSSGLEGLSIIEEEIIPYQPHLLLLDTKLPGITGWSICERVRNTEYGKTMGIIGMSMENFEQEWMEAGADLFLPKRNINGEALEVAIEQVLGGRRK